MAIALEEPKTTNSPWVTGAEAARMAGVTTTSIRHWRLTGRVRSISVKSKQFAGKDLYLVCRADVEKWVIQRKGVPLPTKLPEVGDVIPSIEAARRLQVSPGHINQWIRSGRLLFSKEVYVIGTNNDNRRVVLVATKEIQRISAEREAKGIKNDPGVSLREGDVCPIPLERLMATSDAAKFLGTSVNNLAVWRSSGRVQFSIKRKKSVDSRVLKTFYDRDEIEKCKKERDQIDKLEKDPSWLGWPDLLTFTGIPAYALRNHIRTRNFPRQLFSLGRRKMAYYHKPEVLAWLKEKDGEYTGFDDSGLLHTYQAAEYTGFSNVTINQHVKKGTLKYKYHRKNTIPVVLKSKGKIDGRGFWFEKTELDRWKNWMWDKLMGNRTWRTKALRRIRAKYLEDGKGATTAMPYQIDTDPNNEVTRTPRIADPEDRKRYQSGLVDSGEISIELAEALESQIIDTLEADEILLTPHDLYQLVMGFRHVKEQWSILKERKVKTPKNAGERLQQALPLISKRAKEITESGVGLSADSTYYLTQAARYVQQELLKRDKTEVADTGESADDLFVALEEI